MYHNSWKLAGSTPRDVRMGRTRKGLQEALLKLATDKPFEDVTVRDICAEAGVAYSTFVRHYATKEALLEDSAADQVRRLVEIWVAVGDAEGTRESCLAACRYIEEHRALWTILLEGGAKQTVRDEFMRVATTLARDRSHGLLPDELGIAIAVCAQTEIISWWLRQPAGIPLEHIATMLDRLAISPVVNFTPG